MSLKDENLLDYGFDENVLSLVLDNDFVVINNVFVVAKVVSQNIGAMELKTQYSLENFLEDGFWEECGFEKLVRMWLAYKNVVVPTMN